MAFKKHAKASLVRSNVLLSEWEDLSLASPQSRTASDRGREASRVAIAKYDPDQYLFSHCTIVASVDTYKAGQPTGKVMVDGFEVNRRFPDFRITADTQKFINNNEDAFQRDLLLSSYRTFIGAESYLEHLQIPEFSKGKIVDAVPRDIGSSVYIDILVANDRKHKPLIEAILSGKLKTLSMGASVLHTTCTKCGNVAEDETQLCPCIQYFKGNTFLDEEGQKHRISELCGHVSEPDSVKFIEASWVANPAFVGAVLRKILNPEGPWAKEAKEALALKLHVAYTSSNTAPINKAATRIARDLHLGQGQEDPFADGGQGGQAPQDKPEADPLEEATNALYETLKERLTDKARKDIDKATGKDLEDAATSAKDSNGNDTLIKSAMASPQWTKVARALKPFVAGLSLGTRRNLFAALVKAHAFGWQSLKGMPLSERVSAVYLADRVQGLPRFAGEKKAYEVLARMPSDLTPQAYMEACRVGMGRALTPLEAKWFQEKGVRLFFFPENL